MAKYTKQDVIDKLIHMRVKEGKTRNDIFLYLRDELGYTIDTVYHYMKWSREEIADRTLKSFAQDIHEDIERFESLYNSCLKDGNKKLAKECLEQIAKLKGHYIERKDVTSGGKPIDEIKIIHIKSNKIDSKDDGELFGLNDID